MRSEHIVAQHHRDLQIRRGLQHGARAGDGIHAAGVGDHLDVAFLQLLRDAADQRGKVAGIAEFGVLLALLLQDGHGDFGQIIEGEIVDRAAVHQADGSFQPVAPEALTVSDANHKAVIGRQWRRRERHVS